MLIKDIPVTAGWVDNPRSALNGMYLAAWVANYGIASWQVSDWKPVEYIPESIIGDQDVVDYQQYFDFTAVGEEGRIAIWNGMENARSLDIGKSQVIIIRISPDGSLLACGLLDGTIELWQLPEGNLLDSFQSTTGRILSLDFSAGDKTLISFSTDQIIKLWAVH
jgi:WD40 repeat protein